MPVIAHITGTHSDDPYDCTIALHETPLPGDTIKLPDGRTVAVVTRQFTELPTTKELLARTEDVGDVELTVTGVQ